MTKEGQNIGNRSVGISDEISIKELILKVREWYRFFLSRWLAILVYGCMGAILGLTYSFLQKPVYTAATTFVLEEDTGSSGGMLGQLGGLAGLAGMDIGINGGGIFQGDNLPELYKSRTMIQKTLLSEVAMGDKKQMLIDRYIEFNKLRQKWAEKPNLEKINFKQNSRRQFSRLQDSIINIIVADINKNYLTVEKPNKKLSIISVQVKSEDEYFAKTFNDQIVKNVNDFYIQTKTKKSLGNVAILQQKADSVWAVLNGAVYTSVSVADATPNLNITRQVQRSVPIQKAQISVEANKLILGELVKNLEMSKMTLRQETPLIQIVDQPVFPLAKERLGKIKSIIVGGFLAGFLAVVIIFFQKLIKEIMA